MACPPRARPAPTVQWFDTTCTASGRQAPFYPVSKQYRLLALDEPDVGDVVELRVWRRIDGSAETRKADLLLQLLALEYATLARHGHLPNGLVRHRCPPVRQARCTCSSRTSCRFAGRRTRSASRAC